MRKMKSCKRNNNVNTRIPKTFEEDINSENADKWKDVKKKKKKKN